MKKQFLSGVLAVGTLAIGCLLYVSPADAAKVGSSSNGNGNSNSNGGGSSTTVSPVLPVLGNHACSVNDVLLATANANQCYGMVVNPNNDVGNAPNLLTFLNNAGDNLDFGYVGQWIAAGKEVDNGNGTATNFSNGTFTSTTTSGSAAKDGAWSLQLNNALIQALVISVKGGDGWSAYLFDPANLANSFSGTWTTLGLRNNGGQQPNISHISAYYVVGQQPPNPIPTPALLPGLIGMGAAALRKKKREGGTEEVTQEA